ncbi:MAG: Mtase protein [Ignavibacteria bacterium]|nr:Mtase protein [Ignavibacteria bacterium]
MKQLYIADCLDVLIDLNKKYPEGLIDLIYIDPPFNSKRNYNVLFEDISMKEAKAQRQAFSDTWSNVSYIDTLNNIDSLNKDLFDFLKTLNKINISKSAVSYLTIMSIRIYYMHKLLKDTGSFYLHCDPTMSHYLKVICDLIFGDKKKGYKNEIVWKRTSSLKTSQFTDKKFGVSTDIILFFTKSEDYYFNSEAIKIPFSSKDVEGHYPFSDNKGPFTKSPLFRSMGMGERPNLCYEYKGVNAPSKAGWKISLEKLKKLDIEDDIDWTNPKLPYRKFRPTHTKGWLVSNLWLDIEQTSGNERLGYPTQKPEALLERIIKASTRESDVIADFFCGCGTSVAVANRLNRDWIGVDISHLAIKLIIDRLTKPLSIESRTQFIKDIEIHGFPKDIASAKELARKDNKGRFEFQDWIVEFLLGGILNPKKSADGGWDGYISFHKSEKEKGNIFIEVKSGHVGVKNIREFINVVETNEVDLGVFVCFQEELTKPMEQAAKETGKYKGYQFDIIQIITIEDLLEGKFIKMPGGVESSTFKQATKDVRPEKSIKRNLF